MIERKYVEKAPALRETIVLYAACTDHIRKLWTWPIDSEIAHTPGKFPLKIREKISQGKIGMFYSFAVKCFSSNVLWIFLIHGAVKEHLLLIKNSDYKEFYG